MPRTPFSGNVTLSKVDLAMIDLGLAIMQENKGRSLPDLLNAKDLPTHGVLVRRPSDHVGIWAEIAEAAVQFVKDYMVAIGASGFQVLDLRGMSVEELKKISIERNFSINQLIAAREEINLQKKNK